MEKNTCKRSLPLVLFVGLSFALSRGVVFSQQEEHAQVVREAIGGTFSYAAANTASATQNSPIFALGTIPAGTTIRIGTCSGDDSLPQASASGDTFLRVLFNGSEVGLDDDTCGIASYLTLTVPFTGNVSVKAGCYSTNACSGTIQFLFGIPDSNGSVADATGAFNAIVGTAPSRHKLNLRQNGLVGSGYCCSRSTHFQGIQRIAPLVAGLAAEDWFVFSGSQGGDLWSARFAPTGSNGLIGPQPEIPNPQTGVVSIVRAPWNGSGHLGGLQVCGRWLAGGVETGSQAVVKFWDVANPSSLTRARDDLFIANDQACCIALTKLPGVNQPFLLAVPGGGSDRVKMFVLEGTLRRYAHLPVSAWSFRGMLHLGPDWPELNSPQGFQTLNFINQDDGRLFLVGMWGKNASHPERGTDTAILYEVHHAGLSNFSVTKVAEKIWVWLFWNKDII